MKRFWFVLLSLGLVMAFSTSAFAVDVKFSGSYFAAGMYVNKTTLNDKATAAEGPSTAFFYQRLQLTTDFVVSPGLSLMTRVNIMQRAWGAARTDPGVADVKTYGTSATGAENENIGFDKVLLTYASPIGLFIIGTQPNDLSWGPVFNDGWGAAAGSIQYVLPLGKVTVGGGYFKVGEESYTSMNTLVTQSDKDTEKYFIFGIYGDKNIEAGLLGLFLRSAGARSSNEATSNVMKLFFISPYVKATLGPVKVQAVVDYYFGKAVEMDSVVGRDVDISSLCGWVDALATFGPVYVGGTFAYAQGQGSDATKVNTLATGGLAWSPTLIMWNQDRASWFGNLGTDAGAFGAAMTNAFFYQVRGGVKPTDTLDIGASVTMAQADQLNGALAGYVSKDYGYEIDVTGTYKITNNLSYMLGFGYLFTGDYFKGTSSSNKVNNDFLVTNKLTLTF